MSFRHGSLMFCRFIFKHELSRTKGKKTSKQLADLEEKRSSLIQQIRIWRPIQLPYAPHVASLIPLVLGDMANDDGHYYSNPESMLLYLPSSLPTDISQHPELKDIRDVEHHLREAQADDALADVRRLCHIIQGLWQFKKLNVSGTRNCPNTQMLNLYMRFEMKLQHAANRYNVSYTALKGVDANGCWNKWLKELKPSDLRGPGRDAEKSRGWWIEWAI